MVEAVRGRRARPQAEYARGWHAKRALGFPLTLNKCSNSEFVKIVYVVKKRKKVLNGDINYT